MVCKMDNIDMASFVLVMVGGVNWGLVGLGSFAGSDWNLVNMILGSVPVLRDLVYVLVGVSAVYAIKKHCCKK